MDINSYVDYTNLKAYATKEDIKQLCQEAVNNRFASVCVNPCYVELAKSLVEGSNVNVCTVIGFPLGANMLAVKEYEAISAIELGADEIDMVINIGALKDRDYDYVKEEIETIRDSIGGKTLKVIIETCYLTEEEIKKMVEICNNTYVHFVKTSTGYGSRGANLEDIKTIQKYKNEVLEIKASGGIKTYEQAVSFIEAGVTRIGTSSMLLEEHKCNHHDCKCKEEK